MSTIAAFDRLEELDRSKVVAIDLGDDEFKANAHRHMAEWGRRPPFYVLRKGSPPQVVVGRYADVRRGPAGSSSTSSWTRSSSRRWTERSTSAFAGC